MSNLKRLQTGFLNQFLIIAQQNCNAFVKTMHLFTIVLQDFLKDKMLSAIQ